MAKFYIVLNQQGVPIDVSRWRGKAWESATQNSTVSNKCRVIEVFEQPELFCYKHDQQDCKECNA